jgi:3-hydroxybutyryl-CoA dehydratase
MTDLREYSFEELSIGQKEKFTIKISKSMLNEFAKISGDTNPLHMDDHYAKSQNFDSRVCHGMLLASFFSRLVGMYLPGKYALYFSQTLNFQNPCYLDDEITVEGEITEKSNSTRMINILTKILHKNGKCLVDGNAKVIVRNIS